MRYTIGIALASVVVISRAVNQVPTLVDLCSHFIAHNVVHNKGYSASVAHATIPKEIGTHIKNSLLTHYTPEVWNLLDKHKAYFKLDGDHTNTLLCIALSANNLYMVTGSYDKTARVWSTATKKRIVTLRGHGEAVSCAAISNDGKVIVTGSNDDTVRIWHIDTNECISIDDFYGIQAVAISNDKRFIASAAIGNGVCLWDTYTGNLLQELHGEFGKYSSLIISNDDSYVIASAFEHIFDDSFKSTIHIWDSKTGTCKTLLQGHENGIRSLALSNDNQYIISGSEDNTIKIWHMLTEQCITTLTGHNEGITSVLVTSNDALIISSSLDGTIRVWDRATGKCIKLLNHNYLVWSLAVSSDNNFVLFTSNDHLVHMLTIKHIMDQPLDKVINLLHA